MDGGRFFGDTVMTVEIIQGRGYEVTLTATEYATFRFLAEKERVDVTDIMEELLTSYLVRLKYYSGR